jgi:nucleotide-binding universal stress UspA family protein
MQQGTAAAQDAGFDAAPLRVVAEQKTAEVIVRTADEQDAPVIVMGQRGRSALGVAVLGSVARGVINSFHRPVMLVAPVDASAHAAAPARPPG